MGLKVLWYCQPVISGLGLPKGPSFSTSTASRIFLWDDELFVIVQSIWKTYNWNWFPFFTWLEKVYHLSLIICVKCKKLDPFKSKMHSHHHSHCTWLKLRWNYLPTGLCWDLGLSNIFCCCLVNSCGGLRKGEPVQSWVHSGKSTMPGCEKGCQIWCT